MKGSSILRFLIVLLLVVFVGHQSISAIYKPIKTETAIYDTATNGLKVTGLIVRNETYVKNSKEGVLHFAVDDGERVSKGGTVANLYENESASITVTEIENVKSKIADLEDILSYNDIEAANLDVINSKVKSTLNKYITAVADGEFSDVKQSENELLSSINRKKAALGGANDFSSQLKELKAELKNLSSDLPKAKGKITSKNSGYFVSKIDGYESVLKTDNIAELTPEFLDGIAPKDPKGNVIGKIVSDYKWYIAANIDVGDSLKYKEGDAVKIETTIKASPVLSCIIEKINISKVSDRAVIVFSCNEMNKELAAMRSGPMTVVSKEYSGLKIPKKALRVVDSQRGVYVVNGMQINFVPVNILYSTDAFIICEKQNDNDNVLKLYDSVVVKGKKLYDGKIIG